MESIILAFITIGIGLCLLLAAISWAEGDKKHKVDGDKKPKVDQVKTTESFSSDAWAFAINTFRYNLENYSKKDQLQESIKFIFSFKKSESRDLKASELIVEHFSFFKENSLLIYTMNNEVLKASIEDHVMIMLYDAYLKNIKEYSKTHTT